MSNINHNKEIPSSAAPKEEPAWLNFTGVFPAQGASTPTESSATPTEATAPKQTDKNKPAVKKVSKPKAATPEVKKEAPSKDTPVEAKSDNAEKAVDKKNASASKNTLESNGIDKESLDTAVPAQEEKPAEEPKTVPVTALKDEISASQEAPAASSAPNDNPDNSSDKKTYIKESTAKEKTAKENQPSGSFFSSGGWQNWGKPIIVLTVICLCVTLLLGVTNQITQPLIETNAAAAAVSARKELLPAAEGFEDITPSPLPSNISAVYQATNDIGYIVESFSSGYKSSVPAMVAFDAAGNIVGVNFPKNEESAGLGQKVSTDPAFAAQFAGREAESIDSGAVDAIANATISSDAAVSAVNIAISYYQVELMGGTLQYDVPEEVFMSLVPGVKNFESLEIQQPNVAGAYLADNGSYVIVGQGQGVKTVTAVVALDDGGTILAVWGDTSKETPDIGEPLGEDPSFIQQFTGQKDTQGIDHIAGVTKTSEGVQQAVQAALDALPAAKEAAGK